MTLKATTAQRQQHKVTRTNGWKKKKKGSSKQQHRKRQQQHKIICCLKRIAINRISSTHSQHHSTSNYVYIVRIEFNVCSGFIFLFCRLSFVFSIVLHVVAIRRRSRRRYHRRTHIQYNTQQRARNSSNAKTCVFVGKEARVSFLV